MAVQTGLAAEPHAGAAALSSSSSPTLSVEPGSVETFSQVVPVSIIFSVLSLALTLCVNMIYFSSKRLRRDHASTLINIITLADTAYTMKFFVGAVAWAVGYRDERSSFHLISDNCRVSAAYGQFTGMACIGWNAAWMYDLVVALSNPLTNTAALRRWYHLVIWSLAVGTTVAVIATPIPSTADDHTCRPQATTAAGLLFILPLFLAMGLGLLSLTYAVLRLSGGSRKNAEIRNIRRSLRNRHALYVAAFILLWAWPLLHDYVDQADQIVSLTVLDAVAVSGQAAVFAAIRLSEPGAAAMFAALVRRLYRALCVYPCARCVRGRNVADADADFDRAALAAALERAASEYESGGNKAGWGGSPHRDAGGGYSELRPSPRRISREDSGLGYLPPWLRRAVQGGPVGGEGNGLLTGRGATPKGSSVDPSQRVAAAALATSARVKASVDDDVGGSYEGGGDIDEEEEEEDEEWSVGGGRGGVSFDAVRNAVAEDMSGAEGGPAGGRTTGRSSSFFGFFGVTSPFTLRLPSQDGGLSVHVEGDEGRGTSLLSDDRTGGSSARLSRKGSGVVSRGGGAATPSSQPPASSPLRSSAHKAKETSFALAEAAALGSGWDVASAAGLRMELGAAMLTALVEAVAAGDVRARGGREASVYAMRRPAPRRTRSRGRSGEADSAYGGKEEDPRARALSGAAHAGGRARDLYSGLEAVSSSSDEEDSPEDDAQVMFNPSAPDSRRSIASWLRDPTTVHLTVDVRHPLRGGPNGSSSSSGGGAHEQGGREEEEEEDLVPVRVASFADADFSYIRRAAAVSTGEVTRGFSPDLLRKGVLRAHFSDGASSSFFCRSADGALVVKTLSSSEVEMMLRLLPAYARHLADNPDSLLVRFYGCYCVTLSSGTRATASGGSKVYFTIMSNVFPVTASLGAGGRGEGASASSGGGELGEGGAPARPATVGAGTSAAQLLSVASGHPGLVVFDLKGSSINRRARGAKEDLQPKGGAGASGEGASAGPDGKVEGSGGGKPASKPSSLLLDLDLRESFPRGLPLSDGKTLFASPSSSLAAGEDLAAGRPRAAAVLDQLRRDATLLASQGLMDYSLLLQVIPIDAASSSSGGGGGPVEVIGGVIRVHAEVELSAAQAAQALLAASTPPRRPAVAPLLSSGGGGGGYGGDAAPVGPQLLLPVLTKPGSASAQGISITRWSSLAVSPCGLGIDAPGSAGSASSAGAMPAAAAYPARAIVQLGVVDVLQFFDTTKKLENAFKNLRYGSLMGEADVSAVDPLRYAVRFTDFLGKVLGQDL